MNEKTISRRSLLKLASASTVTAAAVLPSAARAAQADQWDETYEIIVVGAGGAGMAAAVKAAQKGAKHVVVLEKLNFPGGRPGSPAEAGHQGLLAAPCRADA